MHRLFSLNFSMLASSFYKFVALFRQRNFESNIFHTNVTCLYFVLIRDRGSGSRPVIAIARMTRKCQSTMYATLFSLLYGINDYGHIFESRGGISSQSYIAHISLSCLCQHWSHAYFQINPLCNPPLIKMAL